jgi:hypothetical protein
MFIREPFKAPPGSRTSYEVRYPKGRKPFTKLSEATLFAAEQREGVEGGWAEVNMIVSITVQPR